MFKAMGYSPGFFLKIGQFRTLQNSPEMRPTNPETSKKSIFKHIGVHSVAQEVTHHFRTVLEAFQRVWSDFQDLPKSAMFKTMVYGPGFLVKIGQFRTLGNSPKIPPNNPETS